MNTNADGGGYDLGVPAKIAPWVLDTLRRERGSRGLSQAELARRAGVDRSHLNELEMEHRHPHLETMERLTGAMGLRLSYLFAEAERSRDAAPVAVCYIVRNARLLMVQHTDPDWIPEWGAPAGTTRPREKPEQAAVRECREQVGLEIEVMQRLGGRLHPASNRNLVYFACQLVGDQPVLSGDLTLSAELAAFEWCDWPTVEGRWTGYRGGIASVVRGYLTAALEVKR